ncbi:exosome component 3'-5' exonuclease [Paecilomyces variotii No. 5]|uniref:Exosome component 3'-5' exonuclease n=1 Tax=Byssochlamys spectabilis (strain No. 5 / NBRC 109023) TaxID=1356009 RepID=V5FU90_BYSSN|nr:exosome component 3'-5' exonuclease [Paecilomyces variotii No. 5]
MDIAAEFGPFQERVTSKLVQTTRTVGQLSAEDLSFHRSSSAEISDALDEQSGRLLSLTSSLLKVATAGTDNKAPVLEDEETIEDNWRGVVDVIDTLLEKADACLDEFTGVIKKLSPSQQQQEGNAPPKRKDPTQKFPTIYDYGPSKIPKPQLQFDRTPDNTDVAPFRPLLRTKPHAIVPLEESLQLIDSGKGYKNPYETEIRASKYPPSTYTSSPPIEYLPFESTTATFVDTLEGLKAMLEELKSAKEIAIDLEHHDVHSYHGLVSLMQISTREKDWVVDTLKPWREELQQLNEVFADPSILKVLHGSSMDIIWLQRDLGLYVVGMFDTYHASIALNYPKRSLKFLLEKFVNFQADKRYQMADWRIRPLPAGMFDYARSDTHYLLYIYDHLRNELIENSTHEQQLVDYVLEQSKNEALQRYERPVYDAATGHGPGGWYDYLLRTPAMLSKEQFAVFKAVHQWRDEVARAEDEGVQCVFPKHVLFRVAQAMPLDLGTLFRTISPVTPLVKERASDLLAVIKAAKIAGATGPELRDMMKPRTSTLQAPVAEDETSLQKGLLTPPESKGLTLPTASRSDISQFWGAALEYQPPLTPPEYSVTASAEALRLSLPIPTMPMTISEAREKLGTSSAQSVSQPKPQVPAAATDLKEKEDEIFTVKDKGGPRKRKAAAPETTDSGLSSGLDNDIDVSPPADEQQAKKKRSKGSKNKSNTEEPRDHEQDEIPFDYSAASSVLHANPSQPDSRLNAKSKRFDPYAKALEGPRGARKMKQETTGKTFTFRK